MMECIEFGGCGVAYELRTCVLDKLHIGYPESLASAGRMMGVRG